MQVSKWPWVLMAEVGGLLTLAGMVVAFGLRTPPIKQAPQSPVYETPCPAGYVPIAGTVTNDTLNGQFRAVQCVAADGTVVYNVAALNASGTVTVQGVNVQNLVVAGVPQVPILQFDPSDPGFTSIAGQTCQEKTVTTAGTDSGGALYAMPRQPEPLGLTWAAYVPVNGNTALRLCNVTTGALVPAATGWAIKFVAFQGP